ncbi:MAG: VCBS repeat-containing protein [Planctomycetota bacterium]
MHRHAPAVAPAALLLALATSCSSTQVEGPRFAPLLDQLPLSRWTEGVEAADVDRDGDLDLFFADGQRFVDPGPKLQNQLVVNRLDEPIASFSNESVLRLGAHASNAKMVVTADVDGDGWVDALFCNAFRTDPPFLYVNRGADQPGYFDMESAERGFTEAYNCGSAQFGDIDDDGDLDAILCDSGDHYLFGEGGRPHLFLNDGTGRFSEHPELLDVPKKKAHVDVQLVDLDGDFDLDLLIPCRAENEGCNHYLAFNDGKGRFTERPDLLPPSSPNVYEIEVGDLDGDRDLDLFFVSLEDYSEGAVENRRNEDGELEFVPHDVCGDRDDNELALFDYDMDGDYDVIVGSLDKEHEDKILRNDGGFAFTVVDTDVNGLHDPTLDLTIADVDGDGRYDLVTAQGEGDRQRFQNRLCLGRGPKDLFAPRIVAVGGERYDATEREWIVHVQVRDEVMDDGHDWVEVAASYRGSTGPWRDARATRMAGGLWRLAFDASGPETSLEYAISAVDAAGNRRDGNFRRVGPRSEGTK